MNTLQILLGRKKVEITRRDLPRSVVTHDALDNLALGNMLEDSPRFKSVTGEAPKLPPKKDKLPAIDFTTASQSEIADWQKHERERKAEADESPGWSAWEPLRDDLYRALHTHDQPEVVDEVDPGVDLNKRIMSHFLPLDEFAEMRPITRDDETASALGSMAICRRLREVAEGELSQHLREQEELERERDEIDQTTHEIENIVPGGCYPVTPGGEPIPTEGGTASIGEGEGEGPGTPVKLSKKAQEQLAQLESQRQQQIERATERAENPTPMSQGATEAVKDAAKAGQEAAEAARGVPRFGSAGLGKGEPTYTSPEQALSIAEAWANNRDLHKMAELFGRLDRDIRFKRAKRVVGGEDEIVDIKFGDNLSRTLPSELALLADADLEDDFFARFASQELLEFSTVGEENAGRGPVLMVLDGSGSMGGERNIWARAIAMCLLHISRIEKRDFALVEFSSGGQIEEWTFKANEPMPAELVLDMASHFFGGGTTPIIGVSRAAEIMRQAPAFSKADVVLVGDGEASFGPEDETLRTQLQELGVRIFGICVGGSWAYIANYCEPDGYVVSCHDFELSDPSAATAELATHIR